MTKHTSRKAAAAAAKRNGTLRSALSSLAMGAGLFAGAQTMSAVIGVGDDTIRTLAASAADKQNWLDIVPVSYAVTYISAP